MNGIIGCKSLIPYSRQIKSVKAVDYFY
jgi:hypothetical protein